MEGNYAISPELLRYRQSLPLYVKEGMTRSRIRSFVERYGTDGVYLSLSGGKDNGKKHQMKSYLLFQSLNNQNIRKRVWVTTQTLSIIFCVWKSVFPT